MSSRHGWSNGRGLLPPHEVANRVADSDVIHPCTFRTHIEEVRVGELWAHQLPGVTDVVKVVTAERCTVLDLERLQPAPVTDEEVDLVSGLVPEEESGLLRTAVE